MKLSILAKLARPAGVLALLCGVESTVCADYASTVMSLNPVLYCRLNETAPVPPPDLASNSASLGPAAHGFYLGPAGTSYVHPTTPGALVASTDASATFNFSSGAINVPYSASLNPGVFTAEGWFNPADLTGTFAAPAECVFSCGDFAAPRAGWLIYQSADGWNLRMYNQNGTAVSLSILGGGTPTVGTWHHIAVVYDGTTATLYVNGTAAVSGNPTSYVPGTAGSLTIGSRADASFYWNGGADEVAFYPTALTATQILAHYQNGTNAAPSSSYSSVVLADGAIGYWRLNEPAWVAPDPATLPIALNSGTLGAIANGTNYPGITSGVAGPSFSGFGANNHAYQLSGFVGNVGLGNPDELNFAGRITLMAWIKSQRTDGLRNILSHGYTTTQNREVQVRINGGSYDIGSWAPGEGASSPAGLANTDKGSWVFMAGTYDGTNWNMYRNGSLVASNTGPNGALIMDAPWSIGSRGDTSSDGRYFSGAIDEAAIFTNALTAAQIQQIFYAANVPPIITEQPQAPPGTVYEGSLIALSAKVVGNPTLVYQWTKNGIAMSGKTSASLSLGNVVTGDSGNYALIVTNGFGAVTSSIVALNVVVGPPLIIQQPRPATRYLGGLATFTVVAGGTLPISYQWSFGGTPIAGATASAYRIPSVTAANVGNYSVFLTNPHGTSNSVAAALTVLSPTNYAAAVMARGPLAYWHLNESSGNTAFDYAGGSDGTNFGAVTLGVTAPQPPQYTGLPGNTAYQLNGTNGYVSIGNPDTLNFGGQVTMLVWVMPQLTDGLRNIFSHGYRLAPNREVQMRINGGRYEIGSWEPGEGTSSSAGLADGDIGTWVFLAGTYDGARWNLYYNGSLVASNSGPNGVVTMNAPWSIGARGDASSDGRFFGGGIDEAAIYDRALSAAEIRDLYQTALTGPAAAQIAQPPVSQTVIVGQSVTFSVVAVGGAPYTYQWKHAGTNLPGATTSTLTIPSASYSDAGSYQVAVANAFGPPPASPVATLTVLPQPTFANLTNGLVLHLRFDGNYLDSSGRNNDGIASGSPTFVAGKIGNGAVHVNTLVSGGTFNYVTVAASTDLMFGASDNFSVGFWTKYTGLPNDLPMIGNAINSTYQVGWVLTDERGQIEWTLKDFDTGQSIIADPVGGPLINDGTWHHVVLTIDKTNGIAATYVDGGQINARPIAGVGSFDNGSAVTIGQDPTGSYGVNGAFDLDDVGIWRRVLTDYEVNGIYAAAQIGQSFDVYGPVKLSVQVSGTGLELTWQAGILQAADDITGPWSPVIGATAPYFRVTPSDVRKFYRIKL